MRLRLLIVAAALGVMVLGIVQLRSASLDVLPEFTPPYAEIQTEALGLSAEEVEQLITVPLEADLLNGVEGVEVIRSESVPGLSSIVLVFAEGSDVYRARQLVQERLTQAHALPNVSKPPSLLQPLSSANRVLMIGLSSQSLTPIEQSVLARWTIRPQLMGVPGVANIAVWGMRDQQLQVQVDPATLRDRNVTLNQIVTTAGNAQVVSPLTFLEASTPGTGGFIETPQQRLQVRHLLETIADPAELGKVPVDGTDGAVQLGDVTQIKIDHQPLIGDAVVANGGELLLVVEKFPGVDAKQVTEDVQAALETLRPGLTGMDTDTTVFRPTDYLSDAADNIGLALLIGGIVMVVALLALRFQWRAMIVALVTVPLALLVALLVLRALGENLNALVLAGLAAALTVLVDEAVAPTQHLVHRLREEGSMPEPESAASTVTSAWAASRRPLLYATVIILLAVLPLAVLDGRPGAFLTPAALAYAVAVGSALLVALTVAPALALLVFSRWQHRDPQESTATRLETRFQAGLTRFAARRRTVLITAGALALIGLVTLPFLSVSMIPSFKDSTVLIKLAGPQGASREWMIDQTAEITARLRAIPGVQGAGAHIGRAVGGDRVVNVNSGDIWLNIENDAEYDATMSAVREAVAAVPDLRPEVVTYTSQRMRDIGALTQGDNVAKANSLDLLTGASSPLTVRVFGEDREVLAASADQVRDVLAGVDGVVDPVVLVPPTQPTIEIEVDLEKAQEFGMTPGDVRRAEATLVQGIQVGSLFEDQKVFDVIVQGTPNTRRTIDDIRQLLIDRPGGGHVRLGQIATVQTVETPAVIRRDAVSRRLDITAGVDGRSVDEVTAEVQGKLRALSLPLEYHAEVVGQAAATESSAERALAVGVGALIAAFLLVQAAFRSWRLAAILTATMPLALVGGLLVSLFLSPEITLGSLLGLLAAFAWFVRSGMLTVDRLVALDREGLAHERTSAVVRYAAGERLAPLVTSSLCAAVLLAPFVVLGPTYGLEIIQPLAVVTLGGLVTSLLVTLFVLPALYQHFGPRRERPSPPLGIAGERDAAPASQTDVR